MLKFNALMIQHPPGQSQQAKTCLKKSPWGSGEKYTVHRLGIVRVNVSIHTDVYTYVLTLSRSLMYSVCFFLHMGAHSRYSPCIRRNIYTRKCCCWNLTQFIDVYIDAVFPCWRSWPRSRMPNASNPLTRWNWKLVSAKEPRSRSILTK